MCFYLIYKNDENNEHKRIAACALKWTGHGAAMKIRVNCCAASTLRKADLLWLTVKSGFDYNLTLCLSSYRNQRFKALDLGPIQKCKRPPQFRDYADNDGYYIVDVVKNGSQLHIACNLF